MDGETFETMRSSGIPCAACGGSCVEFSVPNAAWNRIIRRDGPETHREYLCVGCFALACCAFVDDTTGRVTDHETVKRSTRSADAGGVGDVRMPQAEDRVFGPIVGTPAKAEVDRVVAAIIDNSLRHGDECNVHSPRLGPCSCGLETRLRTALRLAHQRAVDEKKSRVFYQDLIYKACNVVDEALGRCIGTGVGTTDVGMPDGVREMATRLYGLQGVDHADPNSAAQGLRDYLPEFGKGTKTERAIEECGLRGDSLRGALRNGAAEIMKLQQRAADAERERDGYLKCINDAADAAETAGRPEGEYLAKSIAAIVNERDAALSAGKADAALRSRLVEPEKYPEMVEACFEAWSKASMVKRADFKAILRTAATWGERGGGG